MNHLDHLPKRDKNHAIESKAEAAFHSRLAGSTDFILQTSDRKDYGTDCQIEVVDEEGRATNVRVHVQLKGTQGPLNSNGSVSVEVDRSNLNYLLMHPHSFYACYHIPTDTLRMCSAEDVLRHYEHSNKNWSEQKTITVTFSNLLTDERLKTLAALARLNAVSSRDKRVTQSIAFPEEVPGLIRKAIPDLQVPEDKERAAAMLSKLYDSGADEVISAAFEKFLSVLGPDHDAMNFCYMAEINLGMAARSCEPSRIEAGISYITSRLKSGRYTDGSLYYSIGNAFAALGKETDAIEAYENSLECLSSAADPGLTAQCHKNIGSSFEKLGEEDRAVEHYRKALRLAPNLAEAHFALGRHYHRNGQYEEALNHYDMVFFPDSMLGKRASLAGWRINILFNLQDGRGAFREINGLLADASGEDWIWQWCARQVASFGRMTVENAIQSVAFWERYLTAHPESPTGKRERLLGKLFMRSEGKLADLTYDQFKAQLEADIEHVDTESVALLWDRLGHWAQEEGEWPEAESCFRKAFDLDGGHYGYCLGTALNYLDRWEESLPILLTQAEEVQPDDKSWFQVAVAYERLGQAAESIEAYRKAISLNPNYDLAWFNLGGLYWNSGNQEEASKVWKTAVQRFPDHELASKLRIDLPFIL